MGVLIKLLFFSLFISLYSFSFDDDYVEDMSKTLKYLIKKLKREAFLKKKKLMIRKEKILQEIKEKERILELFKLKDANYQKMVEDFQSEYKNFISNEKVINDEQHLLNQVLHLIKEKNKINE